VRRRFTALAYPFEPCRRRESCAPLAERLSRSGAEGSALRLGFGGPIPTRLVWVAAVAVAPPLVLALARLLPSHGVGLGLRLAGAGACVLLVPGGLITLAIGAPRHLGTAVASALTFSLTAVFAALGLTFLLGGSITLTLALLGVIALGGFVVALLRAGTPTFDLADRWPLLGVVLVSLVLGRLVLESPVLLRGDAPFHIARVLKLLELPSLDSLGAVNEYAGGDLHPGYVFPLWHGALALVARLAGTDALTVQTDFPALLTPLAFVLAYAAGAALFRSWAGGVAVACVQAAAYALQIDGVGSLRILTDPERASILLLLPALLALLFAYLREPRPALLAAIAASGFVNAVVHSTYVPFLVLPLVGFLAVRFVLARDDRAFFSRLGLGLAAIVVPAGLVVAAFIPVLSGVGGVTPTAAERARELAHFPGYFSTNGDWLRPEAITRGGPAVIAALLVAPFAVLAARRMWAAFVLGGTLAVLAVLLVPFLFEPLTQFFSLSQARRLPMFLPVPFAVAGGAFLVGRFRLAGVVLGLGAGLALRVFYPGEASYLFVVPGPAWPVWVGFAGGICALLVAAVWRRGYVWRLGEVGALRPYWPALVAVAFIVPTAVAGVGNLHRDRAREIFKPTPKLAAVLRELEPGTVLFAQHDTGYGASAYAPVYIVASPGGHVSDTPGNHQEERLADARKFFQPTTTPEERRRLLEKYDANWLLVGPPRRAGLSPGELPAGLTRLYSDQRYALYRVPA
jgi:hypothetical protein